MKDLIYDASVGSSAAGIGVAITKIHGTGWLTVTAALYLCVLSAVLAGKRSRSGLRPGLLANLVLVREGEELVLDKLLSEEKYRVDGSLEKL